MKPILKILFTFLIFCLFRGISTAQVRLPRLVSDSMILQRDATINLWGWAAPGEKVTIKIKNKKYTTTTTNDGNWSVSLPPLKGGGPCTIQINASNSITLKNVLVGDVWLCAGQSNMVHQMELHKERYAADIAAANFPQIRQFIVPVKGDLTQPQQDIEAGSWRWANEKDVRQFSAVAYFFARDLYQKYGVPVGIINASVGGTPIEAWTSEEGLQPFPQVQNTIQKNKDTIAVNKINWAVAANAAAQPKIPDNGLEAAPKWYETSYTPKGWQTITVPGYWEDQGVADLDGIVWYRKELELPKTIKGKEAKVALGRITDADVLYINGHRIGNTTYQYPQRRYTIPAGVLNEGKNIIVVQVTNYNGKGGFVPDKPYYLAINEDTFSLKEDWHFKVGAVFTPQKNAPQGIAVNNQPTALFNAMVAPLKNYGIKGILWYQGESNTSNAAEYNHLLPALIKDWRMQFRQAMLPFLYVQLPNFGDVRHLPSQSSWAVLREAQLNTLAVPNTGMAVAIDLGEWNDIHPDNKKDVGLRLALAAHHLVYNNKNIVHSGPVYQSFQREADKLVLHFNHTGSGLSSKDGEDLRWFSIAGKDKIFVPATAIIKDNKVVVWNEKVTDPMYVRYAWADNPQDVNFYNKEGLPASPFRTDEK